MNYKVRFAVIAAGMLVATGVSAEAAADSRHYTSTSRAAPDGGSTAHRAGDRRLFHRQIAHRQIAPRHVSHRTITRSRIVSRHSLKGSSRYARSYHRAPRRHFVRTYHVPRHYRGFRYARPHPRIGRYQRYHREVNVGAVIAGLVVGGIVYQAIREDAHNDDVYYLKD